MNATSFRRGRPEADICQVLRISRESYTQFQLNRAFPPAKKIKILSHASQLLLFTKIEQLFPPVAIYEFKIPRKCKCIGGWGSVLDPTGRACRAPQAPYLGEGTCLKTWKDGIAFCDNVYLLYRRISPTGHEGSGAKMAIVELRVEAILLVTLCLLVHGVMTLSGLFGFVRQTANQ